MVSSINQAMDLGAWKIRNRAQYDAGSSYVPGGLRNDFGKMCTIGAVW